MGPRGEARCRQERLTRATGHDVLRDKHQSTWKGCAQLRGVTGGLRVQAGGDAGLGGLRLWLESPGWAKGASSAWGCGEQAAGATFTIVCHYWQASWRGAGAQWQPGRGQRHPGCRWRAQASPPWADTDTKAQRVSQLVQHSRGRRGRLVQPGHGAAGGESLPRHLPQAPPPDSLKGGAPRDELTSERELGCWRTEYEREAGRLG